MTRKYSKSSQSSVKKVMHEFKRGKAKSGPKRKPVKSRKQAIAIGLSKARKKGAKVPKKSTSKPKKKSSSTSKKRSSTKSKARRKTAKSS